MLKPAGPFSVALLVKQLTSWEQAVRAEVQALWTALKAPTTIRVFPDTVSEVAAQPGDIVVVDTTKTDVTVWLPEATAAMGGRQIYVSKAGGANTLYVRPRVGLIDGSAYVSTTTAHAGYWCTCVNAQRTGWATK